MQNLNWQIGDLYELYQKNLLILLNIIYIWSKGLVTLDKKNLIIDYTKVGKESLHLNF
jgi:hypothetical protein